MTVPTLRCWCDLTASRLHPLLPCGHKRKTKQNICSIHLPSYLTLTTLIIGPALKRKIKKRLFKKAGWMRLGFLGNICVAAGHTMVSSGRGWEAADPGCRWGPRKPLTHRLPEPNTRSWKHHPSCLSFPRMLFKAVSIRNCYEAGPVRITAMGHSEGIILVYQSHIC